MERANRSPPSLGMREDAKRLVRCEVRAEGGQVCEVRRWRWVSPQCVKDARKRAYGSTPYELGWSTRRRHRSRAVLFVSPELERASGGGGGAVVAAGAEFDFAVHDPEVEPVG